jgi:hypothetical protein
LLRQRTTKIIKYASPALLPLYLTTTHPFNGFWVFLPGRDRPRRAGPGRQYSGGVRLTEFWNRMRTQFGDAYSQSVAKDFVFDKLGGRTVERALEDGVDAKVVWREVCDTFKVPENLR